VSVWNQEEFKMSIFETIGLAWVIFTSTLATVEIIYLSIVGMRSIMIKETQKDVDMPVEVKEMFKIAR
jgi:hypothetical protein